MSSLIHLEKGHHDDIEQGLSLQDLRRRPSKIANPNPAGILAFASTTFILSMINVHTRGIHSPNIIIGMAMFAGGLLQFIAGMWQFPRGEVFGATVFSTYGTFWMSWAVIQIPETGVLAAYPNKDDLVNALGLYLMTWFIVTLIFIIPVCRRNLAFTILLSVLAIAFLLLSVGEFTLNHSYMRGGGIAGIMTGSYCILCCN